MTDENIAVKLAEHNKEIGSLKHRVKELEENNTTIHELVLSVKELAMNMQSMLKEQERLNKTQEAQAQRLNALEDKPAKRWESLVTIITTAIASGIIGYILAAIF